MDKEVIHVGLYGGKSPFGGRETPLEASVIECAYYKDCSYYKQGTCRAVRQAFSRGCAFGSERTVKGYTRRAKKYGTFRDKWKSNEAYGLLKPAPKKIGWIDGTVVFPYAHVHMEEQEDGTYKLMDPWKANKGVFYIPEEKFDVDLMYRIVTFQPHALMGGEIKDYQNKTVPLILVHLQEEMPHKYNALVEAYPELDAKADHVGRKALLKTIKPSKVHYKSKSYPEFNEEWEWDGEYLKYVRGYLDKVNVIRDYEVEEVRLKPGEKAEIVISDNEQVGKDTEFID